MVADICNQIESNIRLIAQTKRIRIKEFFQDYDKLRSGFVTTPQFFRTLWMNLGIKLPEGDERALAVKYDLHNDSRINYVAFSSEIDKPFNENDFNNDPSTQTVDPPEL